VRSKSKKHRPRAPHTKRGSHHQRSRWEDRSRRRINGILSPNVRCPRVPARPSRRALEAKGLDEARGFCSAVSRRRPATSHQLQSARLQPSTEEDWSTERSDATPSQALERRSHAGQDEQRETIQKPLGHASIRTTADIYGTLRVEVDRAVADRLDVRYKSAIENVRRGHCPGYEDCGGW
jgi:integrase